MAGMTAEPGDVVRADVQQHAVTVRAGVRRRQFELEHTYLDGIFLERDARLDLEFPGDRCAVRLVRRFGDEWCDQGWNLLKPTHVIDRTTFDRILRHVGVHRIVRILHDGNSAAFLHVAHSGCPVV